MKKIDIYIIRTFLGTFFFAIILFCAIAVVIDISEKLEDFLDSNPNGRALVFDYYINFVAWIAALLSPLFIFIAVIFFTSRMAARSEIVAMFCSGIIAAAYSLSGAALQKSAIQSL